MNQAKRQLCLPLCLREIYNQRSGNICNWGNTENLFCDPVIHDLELRNGRWIFTDEYWFKYRHFIDLEG